MKCHAALPDRQHFKQVMQVIVRLVKQHISKPPTQHHAEHAEEKQVVDIAPGPVLCSELRLCDAQAGQPDEHAESGQIGQAVPMHGQRPELDGDRVKLRVDPHGGIPFGLDESAIIASQRAARPVLRRDKDRSVCRPGLVPPYCANRMLADLQRISPLPLLNQPRRRTR